MNKRKGSGLLDSSEVPRTELAHAREPGFVQRPRGVPPVAPRGAPPARSRSRSWASADDTDRKASTAPGVRGSICRLHRQATHLGSADPTQAQSIDSRVIAQVVRQDFPLAPPKTELAAESSNRVSASLRQTATPQHTDSNVTAASPVPRFSNEASSPPTETATPSPGLPASSCGLTLHGTQLGGVDIDGIRERLTSCGRVDPREPALKPLGRW